MYLYKVLVVEDELIVRKGLTMTTPWSNYDCCLIAEAKNGIEGKALALKHKPDIIITDIRMPGCSGIEMLESILPDVNAAVVFVTAFHDFSYAKKAIDLGVVDYLLKPFDDEAMDRALRKAIDEVNKKKLLKHARTQQSEANIIENKLSLSVKSKHKNITRAIQYIYDNYNKDISIQSTCEYLNVSESYLSHLFKEETGFTFLEYTTLYRLSMACKLLKEPNVRINEVAQAVGYRDQHYFSYIFKKNLGVSPNYFKENLS